MRVSRALTIATATAAGGLLLAGCGSSGNTAQTLPAAASSAGASTTAASANLTAELLTINQMPAGWSTTPSSSGSGGLTSCKALNGGAWTKLPGQAEVDFQQSEVGPFVVEKLAAGDANQVSQAWSSFSDATSQCRSFTQSTSGGTTKYTLAALSFPSYGDQTYAFSITVSSSGVDASGDIVVVRKGDTLVQIIALGVPDVPVATVEKAVGAAVGDVK